jgi:fructokinase
MNEASAYDVVCFGEVLWDVLPTASFPGGAPMNVAFHLKKLGSNPALITKIGIDNYGKKLVNLLSNEDVCTEFFDVDYQYPTGLVYAKQNERCDVSYDIVNPAAWDFINCNDEYEELVSNSTFFVFGSLTSRNKVTRETLYHLIELANTKVLDVNLRAPYYTRPDIEYLMNKADILKMNLDELELITGWFNCSTTTDRIKQLQDQFKIETIIVTMGSDGAIVNNNGEVYFHKGIKVKVADTIGSGDAFLSGYIHNISEGNSIEEALSFASAVGAFVATREGACPNYQISQIKDFILSASV